MTYFCLFTICLRLVEVRSLLLFLILQIHFIKNNLADFTMRILFFNIGYTIYLYWSSAL